MRDTWESLTKEQKQAIKSSTRELTETEINERFVNRDDTIYFRIYRKTDRVLAGKLDIDLPDEERNRDGVNGNVNIQCEYSMHSAILNHNPGKKGFEECEIVLIPPGEFDYEPELTNSDEKASKTIDKTVSKFADYYAQDPVLAKEETSVENGPDELPAVVDHRPNQSPVKDQGGRGTCVAHAALALLEAYEHIPDDLSEQCAHYKFNEFLKRPQNYNYGIRTIDSVRFLARSDGRVCEESDWPYIPSQSKINEMICNGVYCPPNSLEDKSIYGYVADAYKIITDNGLSVESIKNTRYLESLLSQGYDIAVGTWVSWDDKNNDGILEPVLDSNGLPIGMGGHAMLVVGYNRPAQYFIVKNSWGRGWGHDGYAYLHYNLVRSCFKYGFVVDRVLPEAPSQMPRMLARTPYETERICRANIRAAVLFMKTSRGRYAVCEAYAGDNLLLRNLRIYDSDGKLYLERDSLVIRGAYLCDIDCASETNTEADFWWQSVYPGENYLVPRNGASAHVAFDLINLNTNQISLRPPGSAPITGDRLNYAVVVGRTTFNRCFKMLVHAKNDKRLQISYLELFNPDGSRYHYSTNLYISPSQAFDLDTLRFDNQGADIQWRMISDNTGILESCPGAEIQLLWRL